MGNGARFGNHDRGEASSGYHRGDLTEFLANAIDEAIDLTGKPVQGTGLKGLDGVLADGRARAHKFDLAQLGCALRQGIEGDLDTGSQGTPEELTLGRDDIEIGRGTEVDDDAWATEQVVSRDRVDDA